ncbi:MAG: glycosyltransferase family 39 protein [Candidatus Omnitrophica bacterium]|nr:glycosyltransferase family 39 protein [Candidatus Omnitrophota bacterium]
MKNKARAFFWLCLVLLVLIKIAVIINFFGFVDISAKYNLFISTNIARGLAPNPLIFQQSLPYAGGGHFVFSLVAVPFVWLLGPSYFSLRLASLVFLIATYIMLFMLCKRYFGLRTAIFASLMFIITPGLLSLFSVEGEGRHFHLNLLFLFCLALFAKIHESRRPLYYTLFGLACGLGVYFYPAFLISVFVFFLFLLIDADLSRPDFIFHFALTTVGIVLFAELIEFGVPWYRTVYAVIFDNPVKNISNVDNIAAIINRFVMIWVKNLPNIFSSSIEHFNYLSNQPIAAYFNFLSGPPQIVLLTKISLEVFRASLITILVLSSWSAIKIGKRVFNNLLNLRGRKIVPTNEFIYLFLFTHLFIYIFIYSFNNEGIGNYKYFLPLFSNIIIFIAYFLNKAWGKSKYFFIGLAVVIFFPGVSYTYSVFARTPESLKNLYKHGIYFYEHQCGEIATNKSLLIHKFMCQKLNINMCHQLGIYYAERFTLDSASQDFEYISNGDFKKLRYLYQGYIDKTTANLKGDVNGVIVEINKLDINYRRFGYLGLGEGIIPVYESGNFYDVNNNFEEWRVVIKNCVLHIPEEYKEYFFEGAGEGLARLFAQAYSPTIINDGSLYDAGMLDKFLNIVEAPAYKKAFLAGFFNKDIWAPF